MGETGIDHIWYRAQYSSTECQFAGGRKLFLFSGSGYGVRRGIADADGHLHANRYDRLHDRDGQRGADGE
jgi:hypothetical protein